MAAVNEAGVRNFLATQEVPANFHELFLHSLRKSTHRFVIVDDSGSMQTEDGNVIERSSYEQRRVRSCSRWRELTENMRFLVNLAVAGNARFEFRLLNALAPVYLGLGDGQDASKAATLLRVFDGNPSGGTPLCRHITEITKEIRAIAPELHARGEKAIIIIATDGEASDGNLAAAMKPLEQLPVHVIVRLCTDSHDVVRYWNSIDDSLEVQLDVLDDLFSEAKEIHKKNPWLTYNEDLQILRTMGVLYPEFDQLDERPLQAEQLRVATALILGTDVSSFPRPDDPHAFKAAVETNLQRCRPVWCPRSRAMRPLIDVHALMHSKEGCIIA